MDSGCIWTATPTSPNLGTSTGTSLYNFSKKPKKKKKKKIKTVVITSDFPFILTME